MHSPSEPDNRSPPSPESHCGCRDKNTSVEENIDEPYAKMGGWLSCKRSSFNSAFQAVNGELELQLWACRATQGPLSTLG